MQTLNRPTPGPNQQKAEEIIKRIRALEDPINTITAWLDLPIIENGSIMISGKNYKRGELHKLLMWGKSHPLQPPPVERLKEFFSNYGQDLIAERSMLVMALEDLLAKDVTPGQFGETRLHYCHHCHRDTKQKHLFTPTWYCETCFFINH